MARKSARKRRIDRPARARLGYFAGVLLIAAGLAWLFGWGWGLIAFGAGTVTYFVVLYSVADDPADEPDEGGVRFR